jgi:hypothetical protein
MAIQLGIEYFPMPPFAERTPAESPAQIQHLVQHFESIEAQQWKHRAAPFDAHQVSTTS